MVTEKIIGMVKKFIGDSDRERLALQAMTPGVELISDIPYEDDKTKEHLLEILRPQGEQKKLPLIIDIHGGGWIYGYKENNRNYCAYLASKGFAVVNINYRLCPDVTIPDQIKDAFSSFEWCEKNAEKYGFDLNNVFITGDSGGGHLAALSAALMERADLRGIYAVKRPSFDFNAAGFVCGAFELGFIFRLPSYAPYARMLLGNNYKTSRFKTLISMSDILKVRTDMPPVWMVSSAQDVIGFMSNSFSKLLKENGYKYVYKRFGIVKEHSLPHVFPVIFPDYKESIESNDEMLGFFNQYKK